MPNWLRYLKGRVLPVDTVFLPGMMCDARLFEPQAALGVTVPDMPVADGMDEMARVLLDGLPDRFALGGLSMGGILAMEILRQQPDRIAGLALMDTNPLAEKPEMKARRAAHLKAVAQGHLAQVMRDDLKPNYLSEGALKPAILDLCMEMALSLGPKVFRAQSLALRDRIDQTATLAGFDGPCLILCGAEDRLCPPERHQLMHGLVRGARLEIIEGAGHLPVLEQPDATNAALAQWMKELPDG